MKRHPFLLLSIVVAALWAWGFIKFVDSVSALREPDIHESLEPAEAIVVLTGGSERVSTGIELLRLGNGKKLFISGVHKNLPLERILKTSHISPELSSCCVVLGYRAGSTAGNAEETRDWVAGEGFRSARLVTANYHMPRSLLLFHDAMPDITFLPYPIMPDNVKLYEWWEYPGTINLLATEYCKYLVASFEVWFRHL
ncbi:MAG: YdcF family protein [Alphaproteobacteria bacterium]|nr:YdcF family protein [Alphaproteobacteria bacterium]